MSLVTVMLIITMFSFVITALFAFTIMKGIGFKNMFSIFKAKMKKRKGWGFIRLIHQTGIPENIPYQFTGEELLYPYGKDKEEGAYLYKAYCCTPNEFGIDTITFRKGDAEPIDPKSGLQTVTSPKMIEEVMNRYIKAEKMTASDALDWFKKNWKTVAIFALMFVGGFLFLYLHMTDAIVEAAKSASQTIVLNTSSMGK